MQTLVLSVATPPRVFRAYHYYTKHLQAGCNIANWSSQPPRLSMHRILETLFNIKRSKIRPLFHLEVCIFVRWFFAPRLNLILTFQLRYVILKLMEVHLVPSSRYASLLNLTPNIFCIYLGPQGAPIVGFDPILKIAFIHSWFTPILLGAPGLLQNLSQNLDQFFGDEIALGKRLTIKWRFTLLLVRKRL